MHFTHNGGDSTSTAFLDCVTTNAPGYGTSFRALSANSFAATSGTAASVTIVGIVFTPNITQTIARNGNQVIINSSGDWGLLLSDLGHNECRVTGRSVDADCHKPV